MPTHVFSSQDYLVVISAGILMVTNLVGAGFTIKRLLARRGQQGGKTAVRGFWSGRIEYPLRAVLSWFARF
jgi:hypothetical protein